MHHVRKKNHRKMLKPKFSSSSSDDDDDIDDATPIKWKPIVPSHPDESNRWKRNYSDVRNPTIGSLNATKQQKLSAEVIQKEEMYKQAETEANRIMFGCTNPGRCLSKDELKRRNDIILDLVNERLKSKLSELMGEFGNRLEMNDSYDFDTSSKDDTDRFRNQSPDDDDDDFIPEAPPPPTFNTSSESSDEDLDHSMTKEFELYEKEIKEKISSAVPTLSNNVTTSIGSASVASSILGLSTSYNSTQITPSTSQMNIPQQTSTNYQQCWQVKPPSQQWPTIVTPTDVWIPPVGPPQVMEPFLDPLPMESEEIAFVKPPPLFPTFPNTNPPAPVWTNPPPNAFTQSHYGSSVPRFPNTHTTPFTPSIPPPRLPYIPRQSAPQSRWDPVGNQRPAGFFNRPSTAPCTVTTMRPNQSVNLVQNQVNTRPNLPIVSKSTFVNAILAAEQKVTASTGNVMKVNETTTKSVDGRQLNQNANNESRKRSYDPKVDEDWVSNSNDRASNEFNKRNRIDESEKTFDSRTKNTQKLYDKRSPMSDQSNNEPPIEWRKLCDIVDKLLDLSTNILKDLQPNDRRVKERNEILLILSDDPANFFAHVDKYGEQNVKWATNLAKRILYPDGRYDKKIVSSLAPFRKAIRSGIDPSEVAISKVSIPTRQEPLPKEWKKLCTIVDKLLDIPTHVIETLPSSDSRVRERNDILMMLSNDPEDFLLHDEKYGARNVDGAILAAKRILYPDGMLDERVRKLMLRQREILTKGFSSVRTAGRRSISRESESSLKRSNYKNSMIAGEEQSRSMPNEWIQLCDIVDNVLNTPREVRVKMSKRDPRWEQRESLLLLLSDNPDKLEAQSNELGHANVEWAIRSSKKVLFPNGPKDRKIFKKLSPQRKILLRNRQSNSKINDARKTVDTVNETTESAKTQPEKPLSQRNDINGDKRKVAAEQSPSKKSTQDEVRTKNKAHQQSGEGKDMKVKKNVKELQQSTSNDSEKATPSPAADEVIDEKEVWLKLCAIVDKLLDLPPNAAEKLEPLDKRLIERNDILMVLSDNPENFSKFEADYGTNVCWAVKAAKKLIFSNGKPNEKFTDALWNGRDAIMCSEEEQPREDAKDAPPGECKEWICVRKIATKVFLLSCQSAKNEKKLSKEQLHQQIELLLQLSDDPDIVRSKPICKKIGEGRVEAAIVRCKHLLNRMRRLDQKALINFENLRSKMVLYSESLNQSKSIKNYDVILTQVRKIVDQKLFNEIYGQTFNKWTSEQKLERNELAILLIKDPHLIESNVKYMDMVRKTGKTTSAEIVAEVEKCLQKCDYVKEAPAVKCACPPIIAEIKDDKLMSPFKEKKLTQRIHRLIEQFLVEPKPEVYDVRPSCDGTLYVVCANAMTFDFLKKSINELDGLWNSAKLSISKAPITNKVLDIDDLKEIKMMLKTGRAEPFAVVMKQLKKANAKLKTGKWQLVPASFSDPKKMNVMVDLESLVELERSKREVIVDCGTIYFDIKYFGKENF
ncbi:uncharacterized protein LOC119076459 [Bradysia coprophila]|uniref:uncharacterized protein LOC119076459 n=1 Tax=Bradysia coprophila TaxID=38358 RepID=UPI00187DB0AB|nr:uncharacterized protein LOC119076459 [Bradysia coprophila]